MVTLVIVALCFLIVLLLEIRHSNKNLALKMRNDELSWKLDIASRQVVHYAARSGEMEAEKDSVGKFK